MDNERREKKRKNKSDKGMEGKKIITGERESKNIR